MAVATLLSKRAASSIVMEIRTQHVGVRDVRRSRAVLVLAVPLLPLLGRRWVRVGGHWDWFWLCFSLTVYNLEVSEQGKVT